MQDKKLLIDIRIHIHIKLLACQTHSMLHLYPYVLHTSNQENKGVCIKEYITYA